MNPHHKITMASHVRIPIQLPSCGMFVGSGIMNSVPDYLVCSGRTHTTWVSQLFTPVELLERILDDNQGNLVQYWGFNGGRSPITFARHYALEDVGMTPPEPDWQNKKNLLVTDWIHPEDYRERNGAGVLKLIREARERGIYIALLYTEAAPEWSGQFQEAGGEFYLGYDFGERFTFRLEETHSDAGNTVTLQTLADGLMRQVSAHVRERHATGWGNVAATSSNFHLDYEIAAGADIPMVEDFAFKHLNLASALSRGLARQYDLPLWGTHLAHEHYSWIPYSSKHKFDLLRAAMYHKYMAGAKAIINESGGWYLEAQLVTDSPMFETPRVELGSYRNRDPYDFADVVGEARKTYHKINYHSPVAVRYRKEISDFYDFVKANGTPAGQPETTIALIKGNLDLGGESFHPNDAIAGMFTLAEKNPLWYSGQPERGWDVACNVFFPRPPILAPWHNLFLSGSPYGQMDVTSFANDNVDADFLSANYKALLFTGWNTSSEKQYVQLLRYVKSGGILFVSIPHLSTNNTRNYASFGVDELVRGGDWSELCGVKVKGKGERFYWATAPDRKGELGFKHPRRFGILTVCRGNIEITDPSVETLAVEDEEMAPVLLRHRCGKGTVYFLNTWAYPGATDADFGPGATLDSPGLAGYVYRHIARQVRPEAWISDDQVDAGAECRFINYSHFPQDGTICLQNIDFSSPHRFFLHRQEQIIPVELAPGEFRLLASTD
ncbi:MAG: hypothetical protein IAE94_03735 [Chthoniobacterales bacterium]|nr:hypothetical protein [Chthoniobacterales bacterium]